jgi:hypothetical protein
MKKIQIGGHKKGKIGYALVSDEDFEKINQHNWFFNGSYAASRIEGKNIRMHTFLMNTPKGMETDHIDGNGLNNQRLNLRVCTHRENSLNQTIRKNNTSGIKGVCWSIQYKKWEVKIRAGNKRLTVGRFLNLKDATIAYRKAADKYHGNFARYV